MESLLKALQSKRGQSLKVYVETPDGEMTEVKLGDTAPKGLQGPSPKSQPKNLSEAEDAMMASMESGEMDEMSEGDDIEDLPDDDESAAPQPNMSMAPEMDQDEMDDLGMDDGALIEQLKNGKKPMGLFEKAMAMKLGIKPKNSMDEE